MENGSEGVKQFDSYDFFAYLIPGSVILVALIAVFALHLHQEDILSTETISNLKFEGLFSNVVFVAVLLLVCAYILGHINATISGIILDKLTVKKCFGYPYEILFYEHDAKKKWSSFSGYYYRSFLTLSFSAVIIFIVSPWYNLIDHREAVFIVPFVAALMIVIHAINSVLREGTSAYPVLKFLYIPINGFLHYIFKVVSIPFRVFEGLLRRFLGLDRAFDKSFTNEFLELMSWVIFNDRKKADRVSSLDTDIYWLSYWFVTERSGHVRQRLQKFLSLYGFLRNASTSLLVCSIICVAPAYMGYKNQHFMYFSTFLLLSSVVLSVRFYYIYFNYFSKSLFRAFVIVAKNAEAESERR